LKVIVTGHTDSRGSEAYNERLSKARAAWVRRALSRRGVPRDRIVARGLGSSRPLDPADTIEARALNRRVELNFAPI
jgi:OOP family OmpA-OmpF porin